MNISINFTTKDDEIAQQLVTISQGKPISRFCKDVLTQFVKRYNTNPILAAKQNESDRWDAFQKDMEDSQFINSNFNRIANDPDERHRNESNVWSLVERVRKVEKYGTVNVR